MNRREQAQELLYQIVSEGENAVRQDIAILVDLLIDAAAERANNAAIPFAMQSWDDLPLLMTTDEVARVLRCSTRSVFRWAEEGRIGGKKLGRDWLWYRDSVRALAMEQDE